MIGMVKINRENLAWAAGFFDGEGTIIVRKRAERGSWISCTLQLQQIDRFVLDKFKDAVNAGNVSGPYQYPKNGYNRKPIYNYVVSGHNDVFRVVKELWPWLGPVKKEQARGVHVIISGYRLEKYNEEILGLPNEN